MTWEQVLKYGLKVIHPEVRNALATISKPMPIPTILTVIRNYLIDENQRRKEDKRDSSRRKLPQLNISRQMPTHSRLRVFILKEIRLGNMRQQGDNYVWVGGSLD